MRERSGEVVVAVEDKDQQRRPLLMDVCGCVGWNSGWPEMPGRRSSEVSRGNYCSNKFIFRRLL